MHQTQEHRYAEGDGWQALSPCRSMVIAARSAKELAFMLVVEDTTFSAGPRTAAMTRAYFGDQTASSLPLGSMK